MKRKMWKMCGYLGWKWTTYAHLLMTQSHHDHRSKRLIQMIKPLTVWYDRKRPQMVSHTLWLKWPHHLLAEEGTKRPQMVSQALWLKWPNHLQADGAQRNHEWWTRPCGWNDHTTYKLMGHKEATNCEPGLVVEMTTPLTPWWGTKRPQIVSHAL